MKSPGLAAAGIDPAAGDELQLLLDRSDLTALIGGVSPRKGGKMTEVRLLPSSYTSAVHAHPQVHLLTHTLTLTHTVLPHCALARSAAPDLSRRPLSARCLRVRRTASCRRPYPYPPLTLTLTLALALTLTLTLTLALALALAFSLALALALILALAIVFDLNLSARHTLSLSLSLTLTLQAALDALPDP